MAYPNKAFWVSCNHVCERYRLARELVIVEHIHDGWAWSHKVYGCSKTYATPRGAIEGMLRDHACNTITIVEA